MQLMVLRTLLLLFLGLPTAALAQLPQCTVKGRVVDLGGAAIAGAEIGVPGARGTHSRDDGRFDLELPGESTSPAVEQIVLAKDGYVSYRLPVRPMLSGAVAKGIADHLIVNLGDVRLPPGVTYRGRVRGAHGEALASVRIRAYDELSTQTDWEAGWGGVAVSQDNGRFVLPGVFDRAMRIEFDADGYYREVVRAAAIGSPLDIRLEPSGFVSGPLPPIDGTPFDGWVQLYGEFLGEPCAEVRAQGEHYRLGVPTRGRFRVLGMRPSGEVAWQSDVLAGPGEDVVLRPIEPPSGGMTVRSVDADTGAPLTDLRVAALTWNPELPATMRSSLLGSLARVTPQRAPRVRPSFSGLDLFVAVQVAGYEPRIERVKFEADGEVLVRLRPAGLIAGCVVDSKGAAVADCALECLPVGEDRLAAPTSVRTRADGTFAIGGLARECFRLRAARSAASPIAERVCDLRQSAKIEDLRLELTDGVTLSGTVAGIGLPMGCRVLLDMGRTDKGDTDAWMAEARNPDPWNLEDVVSVPVAADGKFAIAGCGRGRARLELFVPAPPRAGAPLRLPLWDGAIGASPLELALDASAHRPGLLRGTLHVDGAAIPGGRLVVLARGVREGAGFERSRQQLARMHWQLAGEDGTFSLPLPPGSFRIQVVDCVTGVSLIRPEEQETVEVRPAATLVRDLGLKLVEVEVRFTVPGGGPALVDHLTVDAGREQDSYEPTPFGGGTYGYAGVYVEGRSDSARFFVSPGPVHLELDGLSKLGAGTASTCRGRGTAEAVAEVGAKLQIELQLDPPADLDGGAGTPK